MNGKLAINRVLVSLRNIYVPEEDENSTSLFHHYYMQTMSEMDHKSYTSILFHCEPLFV